PCTTGLAPVKSIETVFASAMLVRARIRPRVMPGVKRVILDSPFHSTVACPHADFLLERRETGSSPLAVAVAGGFPLDDRLAWFVPVCFGILSRRLLPYRQAADPDGPAASLRQTTPPVRGSRRATVSDRASPAARRLCSY